MVDVTLRERLVRLRERVLTWVAWHLPRSLAYYCTIRVGVHATRGPWAHQEAPALHLVDALQRWHRRTDR